MAGRRTVRALLVGGVVLVGAAAAAVVLPPLLAGAEAGAATSAPAEPGEPVTPVISATPVPEPSRAPVDWDAFTEEQEIALGERQAPQSMAITAVQEAFPDDYAYGFITDDGFGMSFKAEAPPEALAILDAVGDPYELHENVGFTELDAQAQLNRVIDVVQEAVGKQSMTSSVNVFTVTVEIELYPDADDSADPVPLDDADLDELTDAIRPVLYPGFDVQITQVRGVQLGW